MACKSLYKKSFLLNALFILASCEQKQNPQSNLVVKKSSILPPVTYTVAKPNVTLLDTCPPPLVIKVPLKPGGSYTIKTENGPKTIQLLPPVTKAAGFFVSMQHYNVEEGLALSSLWSSYCDKNGNIWFATKGGVSRYDGKSFTNFTAKQGLATDQVFCAYEDKSGNMWFGTWGGASKYDGKVFKTYASGLSGGRVNAILQDKKGDFWFGTDDGVSRYNGKSFSNYTTTNGLINNNVSALIEDKSGGIWLGSNGGVSRYDGKSFVSFTTTQGLLNNQVRCMLEDNNGNIWLGTAEGASMYDGRHFTNYTTALGLVNNNITSLMEDKNNHIWFGTSGGVSEFDGKIFRNYTTANGLASNEITSMVEDKNENIWFTTTGDGISRYAGSSFTSFTKSQGLSSDQILSIARDKKGDLWFGSDGGGALRYDGKSFSAYTTNQGLVDNTVFCIYQAKNGNIWFATLQGVSCYDGKSFTSYTVKQGLPANTIWDITEDEKGNMWFGTFGGGVTKLNADKKILTSYTSPDNLTNDNVHCVYAAKNGNIWLANDYGGVTLYDGKTFKNYNTKQGLASTGVMGIFEDSNDNIWFATYGGGLTRYDGKTLMNFNHDQGLADDGVLCIKGDKNGELWAGTKLGFSGLKFKIRKSRTGLINGDNNLSNQSLKENYEPVFENFNFKNGYPVRDISYTNAMYVDAGNILWAGTGDKLVRFDYGGIHKNTRAPYVAIQSIKINNEAVCWYDLKKTKEKIDSATVPAYVTEETTIYGKELTGLQRDSIFKKFEQVKFDSITRFYGVPVNLTLPYMDNKVTFDFAAIEPSRPKLVHYQYILEGYQDNWSGPSEQASASFGNIHEGSYTFKLKAQSPDGVWSQPILYTFKILPPWYRSLWSYLLYIIVFLVMLWSFIRWRIKALSREKVLLEQKVTIRTSQLKEEKEKVESTLSELKTTQTQLIQSEKMASLGELTAGIAHEIQNPLNFVNNFSEVNTELIDEMKDDIVKGNLDEALAIADDIKGNQQKINMHGKRADGIVKGMLEHSRSGSRQKEATNLNLLADEYLRLSYHGLRAKDKSFNADLVTHFDPQLPKINVVKQDMGRVLLNLFNNAFYASNQKQKTGDVDYKPEVTVTTYAENGQVMVKVKDNGIGIPDHIKDKIMQPFFTTKPTGEGTGLGLSLTYDMVVKGHGGNIQINSTEGHGSEFIVILPIS